METLNFSGKQILITGIGGIGDADTAPSREAPSLVGNAQRGLETGITQILATPDVVTYDVRTDGCFHIILCVATGKR